MIANTYAFFDDLNELDAITCRMGIAESQEMSEFFRSAVQAFRGALIAEHGRVYSLIEANVRSALLGKGGGI